MAATTVNGTDLCLFITSGATKKCIALATDCSLSWTMAERNTTSKDDGSWENSAPGRMSWTVDSNNLFTQVAVGASGFTYDDLIDIAFARTPLTITIGQVTTIGAYPQVLGAGKNLSGQAYLTKVDLSAKDADSATFSVSMKGAGTLTHA